MTRGASPTVVEALATYLGGAGDGRFLLDLAGGTGSYARAFEVRGFHTVVVDAQDGHAEACSAQARPWAHRGRRLLVTWLLLHKSQASLLYQRP